MEQTGSENTPEQPQSPAPQTQSTVSKVGYFLLETFQTILLALVLYLLIDSVVARVRVENISMKPTLEPGEFLLVNKLAYRLGEIQHGDIVVFHYSPQEDYIKRVIGLPGDQVRIRDREVFVNGNQLSESYIAAAPNYNGEWQIPKDSIFVLGDNRNQSSDSHEWGFVQTKNVVGRALFIYWPFTDARVLNQPFVVHAAN